VFKRNAQELCSLSKFQDKLNDAWPLPPEEPAAIAVSGGADSFALLHWAWKAGKPVVALTVDHALREGSAAEAQAVRTFCSERNIAHETLIWRGEKPKTGIQEAARNARYKLLCQACERMGLEHLLTAHTADDQAETVFMRLRRGAGRGLAGMPAQRKIAAGPGELITLHRPMFDVRRSEARDYAAAQEVPFVDDPSNEDEKYERVRVRALLAALEQQGLLEAAELAQSAQASLDANKAHETAVWFAANDTGLREDVPGSLSLIQLEFDEDIVPWNEASFPMGWIAANREQVMMLARHLCQEVRRVLGGSVVPTSYLTAAGKEVSGGVIGIREDPGLLHFFREPAALLGRADGTPGFTPLPTAPGSKHLYDKRFIVEVPDDVAEGTELRALGQLMPRDIATSTLARQRVATLPILAKDGVVTHLPEQAVEAIREALQGWKSYDGFLPKSDCTFVARSLLAERFAGDVIRY